MARSPKKKIRKRPTAAQKRARAAFVARFANAKSASKARAKTKRKTRKKKSIRKRIKTVVAKRAAKNPVKAGAKRKPPKKRAAVKKRNPARKFAIRAKRPVRGGYEYYYLREDQFVKNISHADKFSRAAGEKRMREIQHSLPWAITAITMVEA